MDKSFWDRFALVYDFAMKVQGDAAARAARDVAGLVPEGGRVLDAACGTGTFALAAAARAGLVEACDYAPKMVGRTRAKVERRGLANVRCSEGDVCNIAFEDATFDVAIAANVLHLLDDPARALVELRRVAKPGGLVVLPTYVSAEARSAERFVAAAGKLGFSPKQAWTKETYEEWLVGQGMRIETCRLYPARQPLCLAVCRNQPPTGSTPA